MQEKKFVLFLRGTGRGRSRGPWRRHTGRYQRHHRQQSRLQSLDGIGAFIWLYALQRVSILLNYLFPKLVRHQTSAQARKDKVPTYLSPQTSLYAIGITKPKTTSTTRFKLIPRVELSHGTRPLLGGNGTSNAAARVPQREQRNSQHDGHEFQGAKIHLLGA